MYLRLFCRITRRKTMKKLFVYYSLSGSGDAVAAYLKERGYDVRRAETAKPMPKSFFLQIMKGGFAAGIGKKEKLKDFDADTEGYDEITIGSPVWNGRLSTPANTIVSALDTKGKKVSFILYAGGGTAPKATEKLAKLFPGAPVTVLKEPKKYPEELKKLGD